jgi:outer membrane protein OmpA-like peptidoglycan-associated protein
MRNVVLILSLLLWLLLGWWSCNNNCCTGVTDSSSGISATGTDTAQQVTKENGPLMFRYNSDEAITNDQWAVRKEEILSKLQDNQLLEITGLYRSDETNNTSFPDLGIARADAARKALGLETDKVKLSSRLVDGVSDKVNPFESCNFDYRIVTENIIETEDKTVIRFPFNSTNKLNSAEVEAYLENVAKRVIASGEKIVLTGHTDNVGDDANNLKLGQRRADIVKNYLVSKGVNSEQIAVSSSGESQPIADNNTDAGRQENRRTELQIIK